MSEEGAGVSGAVAEDLVEEFGGAVGDGRVLGEARSGVQMRFEAEDLAESVEAAEVVADAGEGVEGGEACGLASLIDAEFAADLADPFGAAVLDGELCGDEEEIACDGGGLVGPARGWGLGEGDGAFAESVVDGHGGSLPRGSGEYRGGARVPGG